MARRQRVLLADRCRLCQTHHTRPLADEVTAAPVARYCEAKIVQHLKTNQNHTALGRRLWFFFMQAACVMSRFESIVYHAADHIL
jgi:hypothetical protein